MIHTRTKILHFNTTREFTIGLVILITVVFLTSSASALPSETGRSFFERIRRDKVEQIQIFRTAQSKPIKFFWNKIDVRDQFVIFTLDDANVMLLDYAPIAVLRRGGTLGKQIVYAYMP